MARDPSERAIVADFKDEYSAILLAEDFIVGFGYGRPASDLDLSGPTGIVVYCDLGMLEEAKRIVPIVYKGLYVFLEESGRAVLQ